LSAAAVYPILRDLRCAAFGLRKHRTRAGAVAQSTSAMRYPAATTDGVLVQQLSHEGKVALVTGGAGGIGRAASLAFAAAGAAVVVADRDVAAGEQVVSEIVAGGGRAAFVRVDVSRAAEVEQMVAFAVERFGRLDAAFNNAGIELESKPTAECDEETFDRIVAVNLKGVWLCMKYELAQLMRQGGGGAIVNTASVAGLVGAPSMPAYCASKHAVVGVTKAAAAEYGRHGIRVNAVCPGVINTPMMERAFAADPRRKPRIERAHLLKRVGEPQEIANAVLWLCSDAASFVTGHPMAVDGGMVAI
jgi:NAD(P)-dependent dehydrogenase (short-subunit alcohol dehydrogenase family)